MTRYLASRRERLEDGDAQAEVGGRLPIVHPLTPRGNRLGQTVDGSGQIGGGRAAEAGQSEDFVPVEPGLCSILQTDFRENSFHALR